MQDAASRIQPMAGRSVLGSLEIGRFLAASVVLLSHLLPALGPYAASPGATALSRLPLPSALAVQYFFVLSGFVMMTAHGKDFGDLSTVPKFWWRRACRIFPLYWLVLLLALPDHIAGLTWTYAWQLLTLVPMTVGNFVTLYLVPAWSLRFEIAFYLIFGLCLLPRIGRILLALWVVCDGFFQYEKVAGFKQLAWPGLHGSAKAAVHIINHYGLVPFYRLAYFDLNYFFSVYDVFFFAGLLGGWLFRCWHANGRVSVVSIATGLLLVAIALPYMQWGGIYIDPDHSWAAPVNALGITAIITGFATLERHGGLTFGSWARRLGVMSYPVYILHEPLLHIMQDGIGVSWRLGVLGLFGVLAASLALVYAAGAVLAFYVDQPVQQWLRKNPPLKLGLKGR
jgi:peptidoglycan/LPS O-acetylase OafA/YrhL